MSSRAARSSKSWTTGWIMRELCARVLDAAIETGADGDTVHRALGSRLPRALARMAVAHRRSEAHPLEVIFPLVSAEGDTPASKHPIAHLSPRMDFPGVV